MIIRSWWRFMYKLKVKKFKDYTKVVSKLSGPTGVNISELEAMCMLRDYRIACPASYTNSKLIFNLPYTLSLSEYLSAYITENAFFRLMTDYIQVLSLLENTGLQVNNLVIDMDYVYVSPDGSGLMFLYQPLISSGTQINVFNFIMEFINRSSFPYGAHNKRVNEFKQFIGRQQYFSTQAFLDFLDPQKPVEVEVRPDDRYTPREDYTPNPPVNYDTPQDYYQDDDRTVSAEELCDNIFDPGVDGETVVLGSKGNVSTPKLHRRRTNTVIDVDKSVFKIGSDRTKNDCWIPDNSAVSRLHATITSYNGKSFIKDNKSTNCTFLNGRQLMPGQDCEIHNGDEIVLADEVFVFRER